MRIALISDIHFGKSAVNCEFSFDGEPLDLAETQYAQPMVKGMINLLNAEHPDYMFIAGDLTSTGNPLEFKYCSEKIFEIASSLGIDHDKVVFCLGNHDLDWRISDICANIPASYQDADAKYITDFYQRLSCMVPTEVGLSSLLPSTVKKTYSTPLTYIAEYTDCVLFVLNSSHKSSRKQEYKHGCLTAEQLVWFSEAAATYKSSSKRKIALLHHHPFNYPAPLPELDISTLEEGADVCKVCGENGIELVIHGHRHQPQAKTVYENGWVKPVTYICSGSISVNSKGRFPGIPNTFHLIDFKKTSVIMLKNYFYSPIEGWLPIVNSKTTPVDGEMLLGKVVSIETAKKIIQRMPINSNIPYASIDDELRYLPLEKLMELIREVHESQWNRIVYESFPKDIFIFQKG